MDEDCLGSVLLATPSIAGAFPLTSTEWARVAERHAVEVALATGRAVQMARWAAERGRVDLLERLASTDESIARVALAHHQWPAMEWCRANIPALADERVALYASAVGCELPHAWRPVVHLDTLPRRRTSPEELHQLFEFAPMSWPTVYNIGMLLPREIALAHGFDRPMIGGPGTLELTADDLYRGTTARLPRTVDVVTDVEPLDPSYSVTVEVDGQRCDGPASMQAWTAELVFRFRGPAPAVFGIRYEAWLLDSRTRDLVRLVHRSGDTIFRHGERPIDVASADQVARLRRELRAADGGPEK